MTSMQNRIDGYLKKLKVYDFSICQMPQAMGQRLMLCDEMWLPADKEAINQIPHISEKVTHIYNSIPNQGKRIVDGNQLELVDKNVLDELLDYQLFPVFHANFEINLDEWQKKYVEYINFPINGLALLGWEVCNEGSQSSSYEGIYPLQTYSDFYYLKQPMDVFPINKWCLFYSLELTQKYIVKNNDYCADVAPWKAVAILTTEKALNVLEAIHNEQCGHIKKPYN